MLLHDRLLLYLYTVAGPFLDVIGRGPTPSRLTEALMAFAVFGSPLIISAACQFLWKPKTSFASFGRLSSWAIGWFVWFLGAAIMMGRAMG